MKIHFDPNAVISDGFDFAHSYRAACGARSKHGLPITNIRADVTCEKCLETRNEGV